MLLSEITLAWSQLLFLWAHVIAMVVFAFLVLRKAHADASRGDKASIAVIERTSDQAIKHLESETERVHAHASAMLTAYTARFDEALKNAAILQTGQLNRLLAVIESHGHFNLKLMQTIMVSTKDDDAMTPEKLATLLHTISTTNINLGPKGPEIEPVGAAKTVRPNMM